MTSVLKSVPDPAPILACTISRDVQNFDLLIEDMETVMGESWGDLGFEEAFAFLAQSDANSLEFVAMAIDDMDEENLGQLSQIITAAKNRGIKVILIAEDVTPAALHTLLRGGADEFVPYPLPEGELAAAVERLRHVPAAPAADTAGSSKAKLPRKDGGSGAVIAVQSLAGGSGATTFAVNLAWELATVDKKAPPTVCLIDLGLQFGSVSTYLDLPRKDTIFEIFQNMEDLDQDMLSAGLAKFDEVLHVFTSPADVLPLDMLSPEDVKKLIDVAASSFDYVVVDVPPVLVQWSETVLQRADIYFSLIELDMRTAQNALRMRRALEQEGLPFDKIRFILNRAPKFTDVQAKSRAKRLAESLNITIDAHLPDGGKVVTQACDHGVPLASQAAKNPLRKEIAKLAASLHALSDEKSKAA